jgi:hypothetical protein
MKSFKKLFEAGKKSATKSEADALYKKVVRALRPEMEHEVQKNGPDWGFSIRDDRYFTGRPGEEDDDWPDFTGEKEFMRKMKPIMRGYDWSYSPEEKDWISISVKAAKDPAKAAGKDKGKKTKDLAGAAKAEYDNIGDVSISGDGQDAVKYRIFTKAFAKRLKSLKQAKISHDDYHAIAARQPFPDWNWAEEIWQSI